MDFAGWEKLDLEDFDGRITTTLFAPGCDFRCPFCHNGALVLHPEKAPRIPWEEILEYLRKRRNVIEAVCVTGGEPTLLPDLLDKFGDIKALGYEIKLDTNGSRPEVVRLAREQGLLDYVAMDIKDSLPKYAAISGVPVALADIKATASYLLQGDMDYEFRTTLLREFHTAQDMEAIGSWLAGAKRYYLQRYFDGEGCIAHGFHEVSKEKAQTFQAILEKNIGFVALRGYE